MTTVRLESETVKQLEFLKEEFSARSYDELMKKMIKIVRKKVSMFGASPGIGPWTRADREGADEDRY